jgi:hypothetical protein
MKGLYIHLAYCIHLSYERPLHSSAYTYLMKGLYIHLVSCIHLSYERPFTFIWPPAYTPLMKGPLHSSGLLHIPVIWKALYIPLASCIHLFSQTERCTFIPSAYLLLACTVSQVMQCSKPMKVGTVHSLLAETLCNCYSSQHLILSGRLLTAGFLLT